ncbi:MAG TPA: radical SAM protein, partial [Candidatus Blautia merdipullorum]|nr:radical SAM protein [Candidatus Blautia merdipullorum]
ENEELKKKELTAEQWIALGKQIADAGTLHLLITGGEPMIRPDFCEIWKELYHMGFFLQLYTNATMVTPEIMETLRKYPPHQIGVTIYGASEKTYDKVCGNGKAFHRMVEAVKQFQELPSIIDYRTTVIQDNYYDIENMEKLVSEEFHSSQTLTQTQMVMKAVRGGCAKVEECRLSPKQNVELYFRRSMEEMKELVGAEQFDADCVRYRIDSDAKKQKNERERLTLFGCNAGMNNYTIAYDGKLQGCQILGQFSTDVVKDGFWQAWREYPFTVKRKEYTNPKCANCKEIDFCWSCAASRYAEAGDFEEVSDYICKTTKEYVRYIDK